MGTQTREPRLAAAANKTNRNNLTGAGNAVGRSCLKIGFPQIQATQAGIAKRRSNLSAFTLFEIMVALCVVAILTTFAIPGFKKISDDIKINTTVNDTLALVKSIRAHYLIFRISR